MVESKEKKPLPKRAHLITPRGEQQMQDELDFLWRKDRPVVTQQVSDAAKLGDRSENAESSESASKIYYFLILIYLLIKSRAYGFH